MGRKIQIFAALLALMLVIRPAQVSGKSAGPQEHSLRFFYNNVCASCHEEDNFYELFNRCVTSEEKKRISYEIRTYNLFLDADAAVYEELLEEAGKDRSAYALPVLVADGQWISGYEEMEKRLHGILFGEENGGDSDISGEETAESPAAGKTEKTGSSASPTEENSDNPVDSKEKNASESEEDTDSPGFSAEEKAENGDILSGIGEGQQAILLFTTYSCQECEQAKDFLADLKKQTEFVILEYSIAEGDNVQTFKKFLTQYGRRQEEGKVPAVFAGEQALLGAEEIQENLPSILTEGKAKPDVLRAGLAEAERGADEEKYSGKNMTEEGKGPSLPALFSAGLLSGFNPCSVSMLLMLFSILLTSHASVLKNGLVYLAGKYAVYLGLGFGIYFAASKIDQNLLAGYSGAVNGIIAFLFLAAAVLNFLDFLNVRKNEYGKVRMQLPRGLRRFNHRLIGHARGAEGAFLTLLVLGLGAAVSVGEFFCTGQIYMASILYLLRSGGRAVQNFGALILYVTAMSIPAGVIVVLIHFTKGIGRVSDFMLNHMGAIKLLNTVLFVLYALYFILR